MTHIIIDDLRAAGICPRARVWCERNGVNWREFVKNGIDVEELRATGDNLDMIDRVEQAALRRIEANGRK